MTQLTYYPPRDDPTPEPETPVIDCRDGLRWGYVVADLDRIARMALSRQVGLHTFEPAERYEIAWSAIALELYAAAERPTVGDLISAGWNAIAKTNADQARHHGRDRIRYKGTTRSSFRKYWGDAASLHTSSPEGGIVERLALEQIWPMLTAGQQEALAALAVHGSVAAAAQALGKTSTAVHVIARAGRLRFKQWWHEGETPSRPWGRDRRRAEPATHCPAGHERTSETSYVKHTMRGGKPKQQIICRICREERRAAGNVRKAMAVTA
ncbi:hypothetical protein FHS43_006213 [Streptosporangium becharense]|uniref:Uncharacterized protein n=1 Tax=Streptosporangium becharense TaxID=1816182 RepID=A0A7W9MHB6_9ACTN|nr:hypothetical protein [Streptosporangium becharense]MBB2914901.1 hypothetical protein [Streptosporangium becharense]MBB5820288.1 hypothetical protein [Streptosporangium becharense]